MERMHPNTCNMDISSDAAGTSSVGGQNNPSQETSIDPNVGPILEAEEAGRLARSQVLEQRDLLIQIFKRLPIRDLGRAAVVLKSWYQATEDPDLWQEVVITESLSSGVAQTLRKYAHCIQKLNISAISITPKDALDLLEDLDQLSSLEMQYPAESNEQDFFRLVSNISSLTELHLAGSSSSTRSLGYYNANQNHNVQPAQNNNQQQQQQQIPGPFDPPQGPGIEPLGIGRGRGGMGGGHVGAPHHHHHHNHHNHHHNHHHPPFGGIGRGGLGRGGLHNNNNNNIGGGNGGGAGAGPQQAPPFPGGLNHLPHFNHLLGGPQQQDLDEEAQELAAIMGAPGFGAGDGDFNQNPNPHHHHHPNPHNHFFLGDLGWDEDSDEDDPLGNMLGLPPPPVFPQPPAAPPAVQNLPAQNQNPVAGPAPAPANASHPVGSLVFHHTGIKIFSIQRCTPRRPLILDVPNLEELSLVRVVGAGPRLSPAPLLRKMSISGCGKLSVSALEQVLRVPAHAGDREPLPGLEELVLEDCKITDDLLSRIAVKMTNLKKLSLIKCSTLSGTGLIGPWPALRTLELNRCESITKELVNQSLAAMRRVEFLTIIGCSQVSSLKLDTLYLKKLKLSGNRTLSELTLNCPSLEEIVAASYYECAALRNLQVVTLKSDVMRKLEWCNFPSLVTMKLQCPRLQEVFLSECPSLDDTFFEEIGECVDLKVITLDDCASIRRAVVHRPLLAALSFSHCDALNSIEVECPMLTSLTLSECSRLESLSLSSSSMTTLSLSSSLSSLTLSSPSLQNLFLRGCHSLTNLTLECSLLEIIDAEFCGQLPDAALPQLASCTRLEKLNLAMCGSLTSGGLLALATLPALRCLDLTSLRIQDPTPIYPVCRSLTSLILRNNDYLLPVHLTRLMELLKKEGRLQYLDVSYCKLLTPQVLADLALHGGLVGLEINGGVTNQFSYLLHHTTAANGTGIGSENLSNSISLHKGTTSFMGPPGGSGLIGTNMAGTATGAAPWPDTLMMISPYQKGESGAGYEPTTMSPLKRPRSSSRLDCDSAPVRMDISGGGVCSTAIALVPGTGSLMRNSLKTLYAMGCKDLSSFFLGMMPHVDGKQGVQLLETPLSGVTELRLSVCKALKSVSLALPNLHTLQLEHNAGLTQVTLHCPNLVLLSLQGCCALTGPQIGEVVAGCPALRELHLQHCQGLNQTLKEQLIATYPQIVVKF